MRTLALAALVLLAGCSPRETLSSYPTRLIDRPYTQPKGVTSGHFVAGYDVASSRSEGDTPFVGGALGWVIAHSDNFSTIWSPIPSGISYQFSRSTHGWIGGTVGFMRFTSDDNQHLAWVPEVMTTAHLKLMSSLALDLDLAVSADVITSNDERTPAFGARITSWVQLTDRFGVYGGIAYVDSDGTPDAAPFAPMGAFRETPERTGALVPIHGGMFVSFSRQWEAQIGFGYLDTGYPEEHEIEARGLALSLSHFW